VRTMLAAAGVGGDRVEFHFHFPEKRDRRVLFGVGSVADLAAPGDVVWTSGVRTPGSSKLSTGIDARAVRGKLSREALRAPPTTPLGDGALMLAFLLSRDPVLCCNPRQKGRVCFLPHITQGLEDWPAVPWDTLDVDVISPRMPWQHVVRKIIECDWLVTSSLHGVIVAETFGTPFWWVDWPPIPEGDFKFRDYFSATREESSFPRPTQDLTRALVVKPPNPFWADLKPVIGALWQSFPWDMFGVAQPPPLHARLPLPRDALAGPTPKKVISLSPSGALSASHRLYCERHGYALCREGPAAEASFPRDQLVRLGAPALPAGGVDQAWAEAHLLPREALTALVVLNTKFHFELVQPWVSMLLDLGFSVAVTAQFIDAEREKIVLRCGQAVSLVSAVTSHRADTGEEIRDWYYGPQELRATSATDYHVAVVLSFYPHWPAPPKLARHATLLVCHVTAKYDWNPQPPHLTYVKHGPWAKVGPTFKGHLLDVLPVLPPPGPAARRAPSEKVVVIQGRVEMYHRAYGALIRAIELLPPDHGLTFVVVGRGTAGDSFPPCIRVVRDCGEQEFASLVRSAYVLLDCLDSSIIERENYAVDRLSSTYTWALSCGVPFLGHVSLRDQYGTRHVYDDDPATLSSALSHFDLLTPQAYVEECAHVERQAAEKYSQSLRNVRSVVWA